jgi:hypothetical protein
MSDSEPVSPLGSPPHSDENDKNDDEDDMDNDLDDDSDDDSDDDDDEVVNTPSTPRIRAKLTGSSTGSDGKSKSTTLTGNGVPLYAGSTILVYEGHMFSVWSDFTMFSMCP